jgi:cytochrome c-type biogenesis protein CcmH
MTMHAVVPPEFSPALRPGAGATVGRRLRRTALAVALGSLLIAAGLAPAVAREEAQATPPAAAAPSSTTPAATVTSGPSTAPPGPGTAAAGPTAPAPGTEATKPDPESDRRLRALSDELRCLVCQNQTLADSNAELAVDLRRQVETMIARGDSDAQIKTYLVDRYGDFVLYRPPVQNNTALLWFGPFALLVIGAIAWVLVQRRSRRTSPAKAVSTDAERRVRSLLDD